MVILDRQPRAFWLSEQGTNIRTYGHLRGIQTYSDMDVWQGPPSAFGVWRHQKDPQKCSRSNIGGTISNHFKILKDVPYNMKWPMPDKFSAAKPPPDVPQNPPDLI